MDELISRKALLEKIRRMPRTIRPELVMYSMVQAVAASVPAVDVAPNGNGEWIFGITMNHEWMKCSACNVSQTPNGCFSYCPNCGAKMYKEGK